MEVTAAAATIAVVKPAGIQPAPPSPTTSVAAHSQNAKKQRYDRCFSFMEISMDPGIKSLKRLDSRKFKLEIQRWAKAVVRYARQVSDRFGTRQASEGNSRG
ncbi:hypothetical protein L1987_45286 [Smallanthus sonchifolius]|uniref:Uncharacterized protein n=1 Tax=Smallanthus sonchifolius TaxID=185202 RepID=A0ACB9GT50_9ASTR|nr:hypothetical protein L1987_45286 [Smallanthus sonchifolius]